MDNLKQLSLFIVLIGANFLIVTQATPQIKPVLKGGRTTLTCNVDQRSENYVTWTKAVKTISVDKQIVQSSLKDRYRIEDTGTNENNLYIENVRETDQDVFTCKRGSTTFRQWELVIEQDVSEIIIMSVPCIGAVLRARKRSSVTGGIPRLSVSELIALNFISSFDLKPHILDQYSSPRTVSVTEGDNLTLWCNATGKPEPRTTWLRQQSDDEQAPIRDLGIIGPWLLIRNVSRYAADVYICNATNKYESALRDILVQVRFKPEIYVLPPEVQLPPNADLTLTCAIQAYPLTEAYWIDNDGRRVESSWRYSLITTTDEYYRMTFVSIVFINRGDEIFGTYTCHAIGMEVVTKSVDVIKLTTTTPTTTTTEAGIIRYDPGTN